MAKYIIYIIRWCNWKNCAMFGNSKLVILKCSVKLEIISRFSIGGQKTSSKLTWKSADLPEKFKNCYGLK